MRTRSLIFRVVVAVAAGVFLAGCGSDSSETGAKKGSDTPPPSASAAEQPDEHAGHVHAADAGGGHPSQGPHGGHLIELGNEEYHAELLHDEKTHTVTVHLLDAAGKRPVSVPQPEVTMQLSQDGEFVAYALKAVQGPADAAGTASEFEIVDAALCDALSHEDEIRGRLHVTIDQKQYTGDIEHDIHDHEGHNH